MRIYLTIYYESEDGTVTASISTIESEATDRAKTIMDNQTISAGCKWKDYSSNYELSKRSQFGDWIEIRRYFIDPPTKED